MGFSTPQNNSDIMISGLHIDIVAAKKILYGIKLFMFVLLNVSVENLGLDIQEA